MMMESNNHGDYSKNSIGEEIDRLEQASDDNIGTGRFYECVFCKRGFNRAQALGGHMNIHRKERAKNRPISNNSAAIPSSSSKVPTHEVHTNYQTIFFPEISWGLRSSHTHLHSDDDESLEQYPHYLNLFGEDPTIRSLRLHIGSSSEYDNRSNRGEDELDLELRLGHYP